MSARRVFQSVLLVALAATPVFAAEGSDLPRVANFAIVVAVLFFGLRKPVSAFLNSRTDQVRAELKEAKEKLALAEKERENATATLASLESEVDKAKEEAKRSAESERTRIVAAATAEAERIRAIARKEIDNEVEAGRRKLLARAAELSVSLAHKKLESTMTLEDQARLIDRSIASLGKKS